MRFVVPLFGKKFVRRRGPGQALSVEWAYIPFHFSYCGLICGDGKVYRGGRPVFSYTRCGVGRLYAFYIGVWTIVYGLKKNKYSLVGPSPGEFPRDTRVGPTTVEDAATLIRCVYTRSTTGLLVWSAAQHFPTNSQVPSPKPI